MKVPLFTSTLLVILPFIAAQSTNEGSGLGSPDAAPFRNLKRNPDKKNVREEIKEMKQCRNDCGDAFDDCMEDCAGIRGQDRLLKKKKCKAKCVNQKFNCHGKKCLSKTKCTKRCFKDNTKACVKGCREVAKNAEPREKATTRITCQNGCYKAAKKTVNACVRVCNRTRKGAIKAPTPFPTTPAPTIYDPELLELESEPDSLLDKLQYISTKRSDAR